MRRFRGWSLRARLTALLLAMLIPLAGVAGLWITWEIGHKWAHAEREATEVAGRVAAEAAHRVWAVREMLAVLTLTPAVRAADRRETERLLRELLAASPHLENIGLVGTDGTATASAVPLPPGVPVSFLDKEWLPRVLRSGQPTVGGFYLGRITGKPVAHVAHPVLNRAGQVTGVVFADLRLAAISQQVTPVERRAHALWAVVDEQGLVLLCRGAGAIIGKPLGALPGMLRGEAGVPGTQWRAIVAIPEAVAVGAARQELLEFGLPVLLIFVVATGVGFWIARNTWQPLQALAAAVRRLGAGEPDVRIPVEAGREVGEVATAFAETLGALAAREADLTRRHGELTALVKANRAINCRVP